MGIYIPGMEMPTNRSRWIVIYPDGKVEYSDKTDEWETLDKGAVPVPPHGRLIDGDQLEKELVFDYAYAAADICREAPTIIPAEPAEEAQP